MSLSTPPQTLYLLKLQLQLGDDLHLDPGLGGALVVQDVLGHQVLLELSGVLAPSIASSPLTQTWKYFRVSVKENKSSVGKII